MTLTFSVIECESTDGKVVKEGLFSRNWDDEGKTDALSDELDSGRIEIEDALRVAIQLHHNDPENLETNSFLANLYWKAGLLDDAAAIYTSAYTLAAKLIPNTFRGQISWLHLDNRPFLRVAHGHLLTLMHAWDGRKAKTLANKLLRWCPQDNLGVRFLVPDIHFINGELSIAREAYIKLADQAPAHWYAAALCALRAGDYVDACTYLRRGIAGNSYVAEGLTGRVHLDEHLYWHGSNLHGPDFAIDYLDSPVNVWTSDEIDFVDWVFNASDVLRERSDLMMIREALTNEHNPEIRREWGMRFDDFIKGIDARVSDQMVRKTTNPWGEEIWPWDREGRRTPTSIRNETAKQRLH